MAKTEGFDPEALAKAPTIRFDTPWQQHLMTEFSVLLSRTRRAVPAFARAERMERRMAGDSAATVVGGALVLAHHVWPSEALGGLGPSEALGGLVAGAMGILVLTGVANLVRLVGAKADELLAFETIVHSVEACDKLIDRGIRR